VLPLQLSEAIKVLSQQEGVTLFMTLLTVFKTLLYRYTGQDDLLVGTPIAGRTRVETESLMGFFVNTLVLRTAVGGNPRFRDLLGRVREVALSAYEHQELPFEKLVEVLQPERHLNRNPLFQVMFILHNAPTPIRKLPGLTVDPMSIASDTAAFAVTLSIRDTAQGLRGELEYRTDLFDSATIARMLGHFLLLLRGVVTNPEQRISDLPLLTKAERQQLLVAWNDTQVTSPSDRCIHDLFEEQVARTPDAVAVMFDEAQLTYRELNRRANQLAHWLQAQGIGPERVVGLCVERSPEMLVSLLGILKAGGVYVPLDPDYPTARLAFILSDTQTPVVLTQQRLVSRLPKSESRVICLDADWATIARESPRNLDTEVDATQLAYIMYTSGSTGTPKGVMIQHRSLTAFTQAAQAAYKFNQWSRVLQFAPISFDAAGEEIYPCLLSGGAIVLRTEAMMRSVPAFLQQCQMWRVSVLMLPTAYWHVVTAELSQANLGMPDSVRLVIIGGERALFERARLWWDHVGAEPVLINTYGPTEGTVVATRYSLAAWRSQNGERLEVPIGRPTPHGQVYILDHRLSPVPIGVVGELYLGGEGLARGYWHGPDLTAERFIPHPFSDVPNTRLYKTGDMVRYLADGNLEFVGRVDEQVKIRGFRVELGEIESVLHQYPSVRESVVVARPGPPGPMQVVAYVALRDETTRTADLRTHLQQKLPNYMMPTAFVLLNA
jgi:amino acid adenylation domain-containing protein